MDVKYFDVFDAGERIKLSAATLCRPNSGLGQGLAEEHLARLQGLLDVLAPGRPR